MPKQYLTVNEVARILGVSPLTVRNWDQKGRLKAYRNPMNNYRLYKISDVEDLLQGIEGSKSKVTKDKKPAEIAQAVEAVKEAQAEQIIETVKAPTEEKTEFKKLQIDAE
ncbi:MAG: helix-turn-helix domain-containing protein [bacterium]|nr:helix-turn-helix domain-containing protein [bacterium]